MANIFDAKALSFHDTMRCHNGDAGYRIPDYQRDYDWGHEHISRLIDDCLEGFSSLLNNDSGESYTFLGTLILVKEEKTESTFQGISLSVVDGQQRLTTLVLIACALIENISIKLKILPEINNPKFIDDIKKWMEEETGFQLDRLYECAIGQLLARHGKTYPYPRIIREERNDKRGRDYRESKYNSAIAKFLKGISDYYTEESHKFPTPQSDKKLSKNYKHIQEKIEALSTSSEDTNDTHVHAEKFKQTGIKELFGETDILSSESIKNKALSFISDDKQIESLIRLLLFAAYMREYVILTCVETKNENAAFDIFDSLNTTGEPLTAIQTLRPLTIKFDRESFNDNRPEYDPDAYDHIMEYVGSDDPVKRQNKSKEIVVLFALYIEGKKLSKSLSVQRSYLRKRYLKISDQAKNPFIESLADVATFRHHCWNKDRIHNNEAGFSSNNRDEIQLCLRFIADMKTSLAIPILCRYWSQITKTSGEDDFLKALKALTAFIVIRRAATGRTAGIDGVLRSLMEKTPAELELEFEGDPLSTGFAGGNALWSVENLKVALRDQLKKKVPDVSSKQDWINEVRKTQLAAQSKPLARFMLLAAADHAVADMKTKGLWSRDKVRRDPDKKYLSYDKWIDPKFSTLEHVAPEANPGKDKSGKDKWDTTIYESRHTIDTLGNLLLLPSKENSSVGNESWEKKKYFYSLFIEKTLNGVNARIEKAEKDSITVPKSTREMLQDSERLPFLDPMRDVDNWNKDFIEKRTNNIASLAWDTIEDWLWKH